VINLVTRSGGDIRGVEIGATAGSSDRRLSVVAGTELSGVQVSIGANVASVGGNDLYYSEYDAPETNNGVARGQDADSWQGLLAKVDYKGWSAKGRSSYRGKGVPTGAWGATFNDGSRTSDAWRALDLSWRKELTPKAQLTFSAGYNHYTYRGYYPYPDSSTYTDTDDARWLTTTAQLVWDATARARFTFGAERVSVFRADYWGDAASGYGGDYPYNILSGFAQAEYGITAKLRGHIGLRLDEHSATGSFLAPRGVLVFRPDAQTSLKLVAGQAYRAPNVYELYYRELYDLGDGFSPIKSETIRTVELVGERRLSETMLGTVSMFVYDVHDLIDLADSDDNGVVRYENRAGAKARGVELQIEQRLAKDLGVRASYTFQHAYDHESGVAMTNSPKHLVKVAANVELPFASTFSGQMQYASSRTTAMGLSTDGFAVFNGIFHTPELIAGLTASLEARNVFNTAFSTPAGTEHAQTAIAQDGRRLSVSLRYRLK
jgi:iron complex outermembrane receptor protein